MSADPGLSRGSFSAGPRLVGVGMVNAGVVSSGVSVVVSVDPVLVVGPRLVLVVDSPVVLEVVEPEEVVVEGLVVEVGTMRVVVVVEGSG